LLAAKISTDLKTWRHNSIEGVEHPNTVTQALAESIDLVSTSRMMAWPLWRSGPRKPSQGSPRNADLCIKAQQ